MTAGDQSPGNSAAEVYRGFIDAVNRQDLGAAARFVDAARYRENCVGFTHGFVDWEQAKESVRTVWKGLPDLRVELDQVLAGRRFGSQPRRTSPDATSTAAPSPGGLYKAVRVHVEVAIREILLAGVGYRAAPR